MRQQLTKWLTILLTIWLSVCNGPYTVNLKVCSLLNVTQILRHTWLVEPRPCW